MLGPPGLGNAEGVIGRGYVLGGHACHATARSGAGVRPEWAAGGRQEPGAGNEARRGSGGKQVRRRRTAG